MVVKFFINIIILITIKNKGNKSYAVFMAHSKKNMFRRFLTKTEEGVFIPIALYFGNLL